jgi:predicted ATP-grasp superfamily ATP-dependent carboligase
MLVGGVKLQLPDPSAAAVPITVLPRLTVTRL